ncbi:MAG TPA: hypothetical protein ENN21_11205 [Spirochaetes bacterium]|nr:hypothetical protein [Spirochaetota bacterium]
MRKINDSRLYLYTAAVLTLVALALAPVAYYSILVVEPRVQSYLNMPEQSAEGYRKAYLMLRKPHVFARYENFDAAAEPIKPILRDFDRRTASGEAFIPDDRIYLEILLERRALGSRLTRNTVVFFSLLSLLTWGMFLYERKKNLQAG